MTTDTWHVTRDGVTSGSQDTRTLCGPYLTSQGLYPSITLHNFNYCPPISIDLHSYILHPVCGGKFYISKVLIFWATPHVCKLCYTFTIPFKNVCRAQNGLRWVTCDYIGSEVGSGYHVPCDYIGAGSRHFNQCYGWCGISAPPCHFNTATFSTA